MIQSNTLAWRMNPHRLVTVYTETDTSGKLLKRFEQDVHMPTLEALLGKV